VKSPKQPNHSRVSSQLCLLKKVRLSNRDRWVAGNCTRAELNRRNSFKMFKKCRSGKIKQET
jgi:hypothetical protein